MAKSAKDLVVSALAERRDCRFSRICFCWHSVVYSYRRGVFIELDCKFDRGHFRSTGIYLGDKASVGKQEIFRLSNRVNFI